MSGRHNTAKAGLLYAGQGCHGEVGITWSTVKLYSPLPDCLLHGMQHPAHAAAPAGSTAAQRQSEKTATCATHTFPPNQLLRSLHHLQTASSRQLLPMAHLLLSQPAHLPTLCEHQLCPKCPQQHAPLNAHGIWHGQHQLVALCCCHKR